MRAPSAAPAEGGLESVAPHTAGSRFPSVDGVRALAALAVVVTHVGFESGRYLQGASGAVIGRLDFGVAVFFLLSGFLLGRPFLLWSHGSAARPDLRRYAARRAVRLLPAYWLALTAALLLLRPVELRTPVDVGWQYALAQTYGHYRLLPGFSHVWSLSTEVAFYVALPLLAGGLALLARRPEHAVRRQLTLLAVASAAGLVFLSLVHAEVLFDNTLAPQWLPARFDWFALGLALAALTTPLGARSRPGRAVADLASAPGLCWLAAGLVFWIACTPVAGARGFVVLSVHEALAREVLYGVAALLLLIPVVAGPRTGGAVRAALQSRPAVALGQISYGIFLWHLVVLEVLQRWLDLEEFRYAFLPVLAAVLVLTVAVAAASWVLVERPLLRLVDRRLARRPRVEEHDSRDAERDERQQLRQRRVGAR